MQKYLFNFFLFAALFIMGYQLYDTKKEIKSFKTELITQRIIIENNQGEEKFIINSEKDSATISMLDSQGHIRFQLALDNEDSLTHFLFDQHNKPRQGWFVRNDGVTINYQDDVENYHPE